MRYTDIDHQIEALASKQHGAFSRQQAFTVGATDRFVHRRVVQGQWRRVAPGVLVLASSVGTWFRQCKIGELSVEDSAVGGYTAAALHELGGFRPGPIELVAPVNANCRSAIATVHRYTGAKLVTLSGIRVTTVGQTLFDIAPRVRLARLERALDDALVAKKVTIAELEERLDFYVGSRRPGLPRMRALVGERSADGWVPPESELEALLLHLLERLGDAPRIVRQASLPWRSAQPGRVDVLLPDHRLIIEADGRRWHTRVADFDRDRWRDNQATAHAHRVLRFTWVHLHDLVDESLDLVRQTIAIRSAA